MLRLETPDLARPRWRLFATALAVTVLVGVVLGVQEAKGLNGALGDTDDAMRLVLVRGLLNGQGWWDQHLMRLQPPVGVYMHWSRLLDGGIALLDRIFALFLSAKDAEWLTRLVWPILWIFPAGAATLALADRLGERADGASALGAVPIAAFFLASNFILYIQFHPGRIDHHDVQMTCCFLALAGAVQRGPKLGGAVLAGAATGIGLAIGLEALPFEALIGAALALRFSFNDEEARPLLAYGLCLAGVTLLAFCIQTPPWRWMVVACDALAFNSTAAIAVAGASVAASAKLTRGRAALVRCAALGLGAVLTAATYLLLDRSCLKGPFADVDPVIKSFWLVHVKEMRPWLVLLKSEPGDAISLATAPVMALIGLAWLGRRRAARQDFAFRLTLGVLLVTMAAGFGGVRMIGYADWIAMAVIAAAAADLAGVIVRRYGRESLIVTTILGLLTTPVIPAAAAVGTQKTLASLGKAPGQPRPKTTADHCFQSFPYGDLAKASPPGLVLSEIDLGPFILAHTKDSALAAPYHRMSWGMVRARDALSADADHGAEAKTRALGVAYVLECRAHGDHTDRIGMRPASLQKRLDVGKPPAWLERLNVQTAPLEVYRVSPSPPPTASARQGAPSGRP